MKNCLAICFILLILGPMAARDLTLSSEDLRIEEGSDEGYHLWIRKKPDIGSVLLVESTAAEDWSISSYALRASEYNPVNGDEKRMLNGEFLDPARGIYSLIDTTTETDAVLGEAFHIFVPYVVEYGYEWTRNGEIQILDGTWFNIRTFSLPYGNYDGGFVDNPFILKVIQKALPPPEPVPEEEPLPLSSYRRDTMEKYQEIADKSKGDLMFSKGEDDLVDTIEEILEKTSEKSIDIVLALDTTRSMENDFPALKKNLVPMLLKQAEKFTSFRVGLVLYKDYYEKYLTRTIPFQSHIQVVQREIDKLEASGGRDIPEAVYEAIYEGIHKFPWMADKKLIILVGDAPPHPKPRGKVTEEIVFKDAEDLGIQINTIILPQ